MGFDQKGTPVFSVTAGQNGEWHVSEQGFEKPLATFQSRADAEEYARDIASTKEGSTVRTPNDDGSSSVQGGSQQGDRSQSQSAGRI